MSAPLDAVAFLNFYTTEVSNQVEPVQRRDFADIVQVRKEIKHEVVTMHVEKASVRKFNGKWYASCIRGKGDWANSWYLQRNGSWKRTIGDGYCDSEAEIMDILNKYSIEAVKWN